MKKIMKFIKMGETIDEKSISQMVVKISFKMLKLKKNINKKTANLVLSKRFRRNIPWALKWRAIIANKTGAKETYQQ